MLSQNKVSVQGAGGVGDGGNGDGDGGKFEGESLNFKFPFSLFVFNAKPGSFFFLVSKAIIVKNS